MAMNDSGYADESGNYNDWIELYNANPFPVNVGGMYVSNNFSKLMKYRIPVSANGETVIPAGGYLILWADDETDEGIFHMNFKLDAEKDQIIISQPDGLNILDSISFTNQVSGLSFGRYPDGSKELSYLDITPLSANRKADITEIDNFISKDLNYRVYPNPTHGIVYISGKSQLAENISVKILSTTGQLVYTKNFTTFVESFKVSVDLSSIQKGLYFIKITVGDKSEVKKVMVIK